MASSRPRRGIPSHSRIAKHWVGIAVTPSGHPSSAFDAGEPSCMACGWYDATAPMDKQWKGLERAHVVPRHAGGPDDDPGNFALLCKPCHKEAPDTIDVVHFWTWVAEHPPEPHALTAVWQKLVEITNPLTPDEIERLRALGSDGFATALPDAVEALRVKPVRGEINTSTWTRIFREIAASNA